MPKLLLYGILLFMLLPVRTEAAEYEDAFGRRLTLAAPPQRIVSLAPAVTELLFALGLEARIVGVTDACTYPEQARQKPKIGSYANPNLEAIALQQPDLVILSAATANQNMLARLEDMGLPVYIVYPRSIDDTIATMRAVGEVTGAAEQGERLARRLTRTREQVRAAVSGRSRPRVLLCVMTQPLIVAGPETMVGDLITTAGGENVVPAGANRYPTWGSEALLLADPDLILVPANPGSANPGEHLADWPELKAVREGRIVTYNPDWVHRPGPRLELGLISLARAIHGVNISPDAPAEQP